MEIENIKKWYVKNVKFFLVMTFNNLRELIKKIYFDLV